MRERLGRLATRRGRIVTGGLLVAAAATVGTQAMLPAGVAAAAPKPHYHAGSDAATFTATGVLDHNCLVSVGGAEIWIKPGDRIVFGSSLAGVSVGDALGGKTLGGLLNTVLQPSQVAGLDVSATIDSGRHRQSVTVTGGRTTTFPSSRQTRLSAGDHKISWKVSGLALVPGLTKTSVPLSSADLKSGASLSWRGVIHVTSSAPKCKLGVSTPSIGASIGPVKVGVPQQNVHAPGNKPTRGLGGGSSSGGGKHRGSGSGGGASTAPTSGSTALSGVVEQVPAMVVPHGQGDAVYGPGGGLALQSDSSSGGGGGGLHLGRAGSAGGSGDPVAGLEGGGKRQIDLASNAENPSSSWPVLIAILAIIALALVAGAYARIYLLGRKPS